MRNIFIVNAMIVDANGVHNVISGYPMTFDSKNYGDDVDKAKKRAQGQMYEEWGRFCKRDDRQIQTVTLEDIFGNLLERKSDGNFVETAPEGNVAE